MCVCVCVCLFPLVGCCWNVTTNGHTSHTGQAIIHRGVCIIINVCYNVHLYGVMACAVCDCLGVLMSAVPYRMTAHFTILHYTSLCEMTTRNAFQVTSAIAQLIWFSATQMWYIISVAVCVCVRVWLFEGSCVCRDFDGCYLYTFLSSPLLKCIYSRARTYKYTWLCNEIFCMRPRHIMNIMDRV